MNLKLKLAGALALIVPTLASTPALAQGWGPYEAPSPAVPRGFTELRIAPPPGGQVYIYEGHRLLGRFDRPGSMLAPNGRDYRVTAMRGDARLWTGTVTTSGDPINLSWAPVERQREPMAPRYEETQPWGPGDVRAPIMSSGELRGLLFEMDRTPGDQNRLDALAAASERHSFTVPQVDWILGRFRSDAYRLAALERMRHRLVDHEDADILIQRFRNAPARAQAARMLGY
ncbi:MAG: DUF4476 domain-containing protein [Minicystis sp.]